MIAPSIAEREKTNLKLLAAMRESDFDASRHTE